MEPYDFFRLYSEYYHRFDEERGEGWSKPSPEKFHAVVLKGVKLYKECLKIRTIRACVYDERIYDPLNVSNIIEPRHEKTNVLHMRKQRRRSASR